MEWIASDGGPLICIETAHEKTWGGIDRLTVPCAGVGNDYDRACQSKSFASVVPLAVGTALVLGSGPLDTSIWTTPSGALCLVSVVYAEPDIDEPQKLALIDETMFGRPSCTTEIVFTTGELTVFDSAFPGDETDKPSLRFSIPSGRYLILSSTFAPDSEVSFIVHKFQALQPFLEVVR